MKFSISSLVSTSTHEPSSNTMGTISGAGTAYHSGVLLWFSLRFVLLNVMFVVQCFEDLSMSLFFFRSLYFLILFTPLVSSTDCDWKRRPQKKIKAGGAGSHQGPTPWGPGATPWWETRGQKPQELLDFSIFKHSRRDLQGVIFQKNIYQMEES